MVTAKFVVHFDKRHIAKCLQPRCQEQFQPKLTPIEACLAWPIVEEHCLDRTVEPRILDVAYEIAQTLHTDTEDLIQKAVGWALREAGKVDAQRLELYLRAAGPSIPRTTVRYAIERFSIVKRQSLLKATRAR